MAKIRKVLTYLFETTDTNVTDFPSFMKNFIKTWEYNNKSSITKNSVTNLEINVVNSDGTYPTIVNLQGISLGNQSLSLISSEIVNVDATESEKAHQHYKLQIYNPSDVDVMSDVKVQLGVINL